MTRNFLSVADLSGKELDEVLDLGDANEHEQVLSKCGAGLVFEHPSARTRNAAEMAVVALGGHPVSIRGEEVGFDVRESVEDVARTLGSYHAILGARVRNHETLFRMVAGLESAGMPVPVVNLLSDREHPGQAIGDLLTIRREFGSLEKRVVAYVGDANNVCRSLAVAAALSSMQMRIASPSGYGLSDDDLVMVRGLGGAIEQFERPEAAVEGADVIYTDVWVSMGEEAIAKEKRERFSGFSINEQLVRRANKDAIVLHCLPAHRGEEMEDSVLDGAQSRIWPQAAARKDALVGIFSFLLSRRESR